MRLPPELVELIVSFMTTVTKENFTIAYPDYYYLFKKEKQRLILENIGVLNPKYFKKESITRIVDNNIMCIQTIMRFRKKILDQVDETVKKNFVPDDIPIYRNIVQFDKLQNFKELDWFPKVFISVDWLELPRTIVVGIKAKCGERIFIHHGSNGWEVAMDRKDTMEYNVYRIKDTWVGI